MVVRQLAYLVALARERHFARAAAACNVTQPTLSAGIRALEAELGVALVARGRRFLGLTPEGERVLAWARRMLADHEGLRQDLGRMRGGLVGRLRLGVVPAALPSVSLITSPLCARHPLVTVRIVSMTSAAIQLGLERFEIDAGVTYLDNEPPRNVRTLPLYRERPLFVTEAGGRFGDRRTISWAEAARAPLCLLTPDMQNRRITDAVFREAGARPEPRVETNSFVTLCSHVRHGEWSSILPHTYLYLFGEVPGLHAVPLVEPERAHAVGLVVLDREPIPPLAAALLATAEAWGLDDRLALGRTPRPTPPA